MLKKIYTNFINSINSFSIKTQVIFITILSLIGITAIAIGSYYTTIIVSVATDNSIKATTKANLLSEIDKYGLQMRSFEKDYIKYLDEKSVAEYATEYALLTATYEKLKSLMSIEPNIQKLQTIMDGFELHSLQLAKVVSLSQLIGSDETKGYVGELNKTVAQMETKIAELKKQAFNPSQLEGVSARLYSLRLQQKDFMLTGNTTFLTAFATEFENIDKAIQSVFLNDDEKQILTDGIQNYRTNFEKWSQAKDNYNHEIEQLNIIYSNFAPQIKKTIKDYNLTSKITTDERVLIQSEANLYMLLISVILGFIIAIISIFIATNISQKLKQLNLRMQSLAEGDTEATIPNVNLKNELGDMAKSLLVFKENTIARVKAAIEKEKLTGEEQRKVSYVAGLIDDFQSSSTENIYNVQQASEQLEDLSKNLNDSALKMQNQSRIVTGNVEDTSTNVTSAATATEEMVSSISEIAQQASLSTDIAEQARTKTNETVLVINALSTSAKQIEAVLKLIEEIAEQTNLLALNATIEAARAGDAGKGFAVVANEVKSLASQTAKATEEIAQSVSAIQADSMKANEAITDVENIIQKLSNSSMGVATAVEEQSAVINEIASNVANASSLSTKSATSMGEVGNSIDATKSVSTDVYGLANDLNSQISKLQSEIAKFLSGVKSA